MPELPEVEITKNFLSNKILGKTISDILVLNNKLRYEVPEEIAENIGSKIIKLERRAKYLQIFLDNQQVIIIHLGMSGRLLVYDNSYAPEKHDHIIIYLNNDLTLVYNDPRKFGFMDTINQNMLKDYELFKSLGVEPLSEQLNSDILYAMLQKSKTCIKRFLMDASLIVGIGNIYASEVLFKTKIHPLSICSSVTKEKSDLLLQNIKDVLYDAIGLGGSSIRNFVNPEGNKGHFAGTFNVYGRDKQPCPVCKHQIEKIIIQQRSSFLCPNCQIKY